MPRKPGYPGQAGGLALAQLLVGDVSPSGRLSQTFYRGQVAGVTDGRFCLDLEDWNDDIIGPFAMVLAATKKFCKTLDLAWGNEYLEHVPMNDYSFPPHDAGYPGRGYRFVEDPAVVCSDLNLQISKICVGRGALLGVLILMRGRIDHTDTAHTIMQTGVVADVRLMSRHSLSLLSSSIYYIACVCTGEGPNSSSFTIPTSKFMYHVETIRRISRFPTIKANFTCTFQSTLNHRGARTNGFFILSALVFRMIPSRSLVLFVKQTGWQCIQDQPSQRSPFRTLLMIIALAILRQMDLEYKSTQVKKNMHNKANFDHKHWKKWPTYQMPSAVHWHFMLDRWKSLVSPMINRQESEQS